jgi:hypothetical protein
MSIVAGERGLGTAAIGASTSSGIAERAVWEIRRRSSSFISFS